MPYLAGYGQALFGAAFGYTFLTALAVVRLILSGVFDKYPNLQVSIGHLGETLPFILPRLDRIHKRQDQLRDITIPRISKLPSEYFRKNVYVGTAGNPHQPALECTYKSVDIGHILFASDYPYEEMSDAIKFIAQSEIPKDDKDKIFYENAARLLKL